MRLVSPTSPHLSSWTPQVPQDPQEREAHVCPFTEVTSNHMLPHPVHLALCTRDKIRMLAICLSDCMCGFLQ